MKRTFFAFASILALSAAPSAFGATTQWLNANSNGNGCPLGTTSVTTAGDEIAWVFDSFYFDLVQPESASRFCRLSARAKIAQGWYLARLDQVLSYGGIKSAYGSSLKVAAVSRFFGWTLPVIQHNYPNGTAFNSPFTELTGQQLFSVFAPPSFWCLGNNPIGLFQSTLSANGQVLSGGGSLSFAGQGFNVKFSAVAGYLACQP